MAANKNAHNFQLHFGAQFFMLFHMVWSISFVVSAWKTLKWRFLIGCWRTSEKVVSWPNTPHKTKHAMWKSMKNCAPKWCWKLCAFLFNVTCAFWKMWGTAVYVADGTSLVSIKRKDTTKNKPTSAIVESALTPVLEYPYDLSLRSEILYLCDLLLPKSLQSPI